jgi:Protein of unknown function (DUF4089)
MNEQETLSYVKSMAVAIALPLDEARAKGVAMHLGRTFGMVGGLMAVPLSPEQELAEIFCPAPFPATDEESVQ